MCLSITAKSYNSNACDQGFGEPKAYGVEFLPIKKRNKETMDEQDIIRLAVLAMGQEHRWSFRRLRRSICETFCLRQVQAPALGKRYRRRR